MDERNRVANRRWDGQPKTMSMKKHLNTHNIAEFETRYRAAFINSITGFKSLCLVGTKSKEGSTNLAVFSSLQHFGANPPLLGLLVRPDSVERHTLTNIVDTGFYTVNHVAEVFYQAAHQTSARYPKEVSEFEACNLNHDYKDDFFAPYVLGSPLQIGLSLQEKIHIELNGTILLIGKIEHLYLDDSAIQADGFVDLEKLGSITVSGLDSYHKTKRIARLSYAKPNTKPQVITVL